MNLEINTTVILLFILTLVSSTTGNIKSVMLVKGKKIQKYAITAIDALVYCFLLRSLANDGSLMAILAFVFGKILSIFFTDLVVDRVSKPVYLIHVYLNQKEADSLELYLYHENISFSRSSETFLENERINETIHASKSQYHNILEYLKSIGIEDPTLDVSEVKVNGNIENRIQ